MGHLRPRSPQFRLGCTQAKVVQARASSSLRKTSPTSWGKDWLGSIPEQGPAFYIDAEDDVDKSISASPTSPVITA